MLTRYSRLGASSRMRSFQYLPILRAAGLDVDVSYLFSDIYVRDLQRGHRTAIEIVKAYLRRLRILVFSPHYDLLWIEKECLPWVPLWLERSFLPRNRPFVLDYDDAVFHVYDEHKSPLIRQIFSKKHSALMRKATLVIAGNSYIARYAKSAGAKSVEILPTVVDLDRYTLLGSSVAPTNPSPVGVVWVGQRATADFLRSLVPIFDRLSAAGKARFTAIGIDTFELQLPMLSIPWSEKSEVGAIQSHDIGIMPLDDGPFERGKCGYKLIQYMACGLPVVASPVGANSQIVDHGVNGFIAASLEEWEQYLTILIEDRELRRKMGCEGRQKVEHLYSIQVTGPKLADLLRNVIETC